ncbi:hypothetical protein [Magnetospirillum gryphiswaldense]|uniref:hypothetical protein n=1 Tax=Magnetospirillum gryphiswaldense TaxID=55518 RepID=UPI000D034C28|nr:hypothetical protein [Magnetospirillum gryphiswaldense]AVM73393.1 hypothetical protein MSR1_08900 [Magnetospirillum gryphiswaldense MSR-1]AVM77296.1 hypothetical protein MSR1L_08900 [Magnetospirillum gryphiswaldense]
MANLRVPSLQHLARNWRESPVAIQKVLVHLAQNSPNFNYNPLFSAVRDILLFNVPFEQVLEGIRRGVKREDLQKNYLEVLPLIRDHFDGLTPDFVQSVERRYFPVARGLLIPFDPPLIYGVGGRLHFPWFSFWRSNPLADRHLRLFVSVVYDVLLQDPDLEDARFEILDFSAPAPKQPRRLRVIDAREIPRVSDDELREMLAVFAEGFFFAKQELESAPQKPSEKADQKGDEDEDQPHLPF